MTNLSKALLVINMQQGSFTPETPRHDTDGTVDRINKLAEQFRSRKFPVIFIQHDGITSGEFVKNTPEWQLLDELIISKNDLLIDKYANDVFYRSQLNTMLQQSGINDLYITGCATDFCVESTIQSAISKDYNVVVVADGHTTGERPHLSAEKVIEHYNWIWQNMLPTKGIIKVEKFEQIQANL